VYTEQVTVSKIAVLQDARIWWGEGGDGPSEASCEKSTAGHCWLWGTPRLQPSRCRGEGIRASLSSDVDINNAWQLRTGKLFLYHTREYEIICHTNLFSQYFAVYNPDLRPHY
jgi:hypothetical protein